MVRRSVLSWWLLCVAGCGPVAVTPLEGGTDACVPRTCASLSATCGSVSNGCGAMLSCGTCGDGLTCTASNQCEPGTPSADASMPGPDAGAGDGGRPLAVGRETEVEGPITGPASGASRPEIAFGGGHHLVIWRDGRDQASTGQPGVYAARVRPDGTVLDPTGVRLGPVSPSSDFDIAWDGAQFAVVNGTGTPSPSSIVVRRVRPDGTSLDSDGRMVAPLRSDARGVTIAIASNGNDSLVVWQSMAEFSAVRVDRAGNPIGTPVQVSRDFGGCFSPTTVRVVGDRTNYLVTWGNCTGGAPRILGRVFNDAGVPQGTDSTVLLNDHLQGHETLSSGSGYLVASVPRPVLPIAPGSPVSVLRVSATGSPIGSPTLVPTISSATAPTTINIGGLSAVWNGTHYVVGISTFAGSGPMPGGVQMFRVSTDGTLVDPTPRVAVMQTTMFAHLPRFASSGDGETLVVGNDETPGYVRGHRIDGSLMQRGDDFLVSGQANRQSVPSLIGDGTGALALWTDERRGPRQYDQFSTRLSPDGAPLDRPAREVVRIGSDNLGRAGVAAWGATQSLAVFVQPNAAPETGWDVYGRRIGRDGRTLDPTPLRLSRVSNSISIMTPSAVWTGSEFLVAAQSNVPELPGLFFVRVSEAGIPSAPMGTGFRVGSIGTPPMRKGRDAILMTYLVGEQPRARRFSLTGMPLGEEISLSSQPTMEDPTVAYSNGQWLVAWSSMRGSRDILATRVSDDGMVLDPMGLALADGPENEAGPTLAPTPSGWLLSYTTGASLRALRVNATGAVEDPGGIPIATRCGDMRTLPAALLTSGTTGLIAYTSCRYATDRVFVRSLGSL
jgi:hypothetical protein